MKILVLTHTLGKGGSSSFAIQVQDLLISKGFDCSILATQYTEDRITENADFVLYDGKYSKNNKVDRILKKIISIDPDVVYSISGTEEMEVLRYLKIPRIRHFFSLESHEFLDIKFFYKKSLQYLDAITTNTPDVCEILKKVSYLKHVKYYTVPYTFINSHIPAIDCIRDINDGNQIEICYIARLEANQKRSDWLPEIVNYFNEDSCLKWNIYGEGPLSEELRKSFKNNTSVTFHGWLRQSELLKKIARHDLFFLCSKFEGLPIAMVEAMLSGVPCLVPNTCAGARYALDSGGGWTYEANSPKKSAECIEKVISDLPALRIQRQNAYLKSREKFIGDVPAKQIEEFIKGLSDIENNGITIEYPSLIQIPRIQMRKKLMRRCAQVFNNFKQK